MKEINPDDFSDLFMLASVVGKVMAECDKYSPDRLRRAAFHLNEYLRCTAISYGFEDVDKSRLTNDFEESLLQ